MLCVLHCLALPLLIIFIPSISTLFFAQESFHFWMVMAVLPTSIYALTLGCKQHKQFSILSYGIVGISCLILAIVFGESHLGEFGEKVLTVIGAGIIAFAHIKNFTLCQQKNDCAC